MAQEFVFSDQIWCQERNDVNNWHENEEEEELFRRNKIKLFRKLDHEMKTKWNEKKVFPSWNCCDLFATGFLQKQLFLQD